MGSTVAWILLSALLDCRDWVLCSVVEGAMISFPALAG